MEEIEQLENGKLLFHSYDALKKYCDDVNNPLDKVVLGEEITALNSEDENGNVEGLFEDSGRDSLLQLNLYIYQSVKLNKF